MARLLRASASDPELLIRLHDRLLFLLAYPPSRARAPERGARARADAGARRGARGARRRPIALRRAGGCRRGRDDDCDRLLVRSRPVAGGAAPRPGRDRMGRAAIRGADARDLAVLPAAPRRGGARRRERAVSTSGSARGRAAGARCRVAARPLRARCRSRRPERAERWDALGVSVAWDLAELARLAHAHAPAGSAALPPREAAPRPAATSRSTPSSRSRRSRSAASRGARAQRVCDMVREATAARYREFYTFTYADPSSVLARARDAASRSFSSASSPRAACRCARRTAGSSSRTACRSATSRGSRFFERLEIGFNLYYAFREGESAWIYAQVMKLHREALGVTSFSIDPYQLGFENDRGDRVGRLLVLPKARFSADRRRASRGSSRARRSGSRRTRTTARRRATLRRLVTHNLLYEVPGTTSGASGIGSTSATSASRSIGAWPGGSGGARRRSAPRRRARGESARAAPRAPRAARATGLRFLRAGARRDPGPRAVDAGGARRHRSRSCAPRPAPPERRYLRLLQRHARLRAALLALGSRRSAPRT